MKRYINRIYSTKRQHNIDDDYESVGEMYKNKYHKKEPYIFTISANNSSGESIISDPTIDVVPYNVPILSSFNVSRSVTDNKPSFNCSIVIDNGGKDITLLKIKIGNSEINIIPTTQSSSNSTGFNYVSLVSSAGAGKSGTYTFILTGISLNTSYTITAIATNSGGNSLETSPITIKSFSLPNPLTIKNISSSDKWNTYKAVITIPIQDENVYNLQNSTYQIVIYNATSGLLYYSTNITNIPSNVTEFTLNNLSTNGATGTNNLFNAFFGNRLGIFIKTNNVLGTSSEKYFSPYPPSTDVFFNIGKPTKPNITSVIDNRNGTVTVKFTGSQEGTYGEAGDLSNIIYTLKTTSNSTAINDIVQSNTNDIVVSGINQYVSYTFTLFSTNRDITNSKTVNSDNATSTITTENILKRNPPVNISALNNVDGTVNISFTPSETIGAAAPQYYRVTATTTSPTITTINATGTSSPIKLSGLTLGKNYSITVSVFNGTFSDESVPITITPSTNPSKILSITPSAGSKLVKLTFLQPSSNGSNITAYKITGYYTQLVNNVNKSYKETITINVPTSPATSENYSIDSSNNVTITLYTKTNMTFNVTSTDTGSTNSDKINNLISSATEATTKTLSTSVQPYGRVPLLYYPIGNEREGYYNDLQKNNNIRYCFIIIPIIFIILYFLMNMNNPKKIKTNKKF